VPVPDPPRAPARPAELRHDGDVRVDPWAWLADRDDPDVIAYLEAENAYTAAALAHLEPLRARLFDEIVGRVQETDASAPVADGPYEYFTRTIEGLQYPVHCRRPRGAGGLPDPFAPPGTAAGESVVLDEPALAEGHDYFAVGDIEVSPGHGVAAFTTDVTGGERYTLRFRDLASGALLPDVVDDVYYGTAWADDHTVFYTRPDDAMRPWQIWRHTLGTPGRDDRLVFEEADEMFYVTVDRFLTGRYLAISTASKTTSEVWLVDCEQPDAPPRVVEPRRPGVEYHVDHHRGPAGDRLYVLTNDDGAVDFKVMVTPLETPGRASWREVVPHRPGTRVDDLDAFADHVVLSERADALTRLRLLRLGSDGDVVGDDVLEVAEPVASTSMGAVREFDTRTVRYVSTSLVAPFTAYDLDLGTRRSTLVKRTPVLGYDPSAYVTTREWATAPDGTRVPISLVCRRDRPAGPGPLLLYGYGSYEISIDPGFSSSRVSLLDRGVAFAIAHIRGGGELGRRWYDDGKLLHKTNTFDDFVACADHLIANGWTTPVQLVARGGSAGGLLMGAVANRAPDRFAAIVAEVPFVDCLTTILDETLPLTITEWEEWGDPLHEPDVYAYMKAYSPYDNVSAKPYPALLVTGGLNDPRVQFWEPAKWTAKLRATKTDDRLLVLKMEMGAGHSGPSGRYDAWRDEAFVLAFVLDQLGLANRD